MTEHNWRGDPETGAIAVQAGDDRWGVMHPENGGHWATADEVEDWTPLTASKARK